MSNRLGQFWIGCVQNDVVESLFFQVERMAREDEKIALAYSSFRDTQIEMAFISVGRGEFLDPALKNATFESIVECRRNGYVPKS